MRIVGGIMVSLLSLAPGCAWNSDSLATEEPWGNALVREQVVCDGEGDLSLNFAITKVIVSRNGEDLATASLEGRRLSGDCDSVAAVDFRVQGSRLVSKPLYEKTVLSCRVPDRIAIQVHPIMEFGRPAGSVLFVLRPDKHTLVASVPLKKGGSRLYYDTSTCARLF
jgi:hypothetical protein